MVISKCEFAIQSYHFKVWPIDSDAEPVKIEIDAHPRILNRGKKIQWKSLDEAEKEVLNSSVKSDNGERHNIKKIKLIGITRNTEKATYSDFDILDMFGMEPKIKERIPDPVTPVYKHVKTHNEN